MESRVALLSGSRRPPMSLELELLRRQLQVVWSESRGNASAFRAGSVALFRAALDQGREQAKRTLEAGGKGRACAEGLSNIQDQLITSIYEAARLTQPGGVVSSNLAIVAVGGYGRGLLAPGSDIDLLFLLPNSTDVDQRKIVETMLYFLWDLKQKVGHATRSLDECLRQARADMTIRTSLLEARFLDGDETLFDRFRARFDKEVVAKNASDFVSAKLAERDARIKRAGDSRYLVEPNVKEGKGGLRDLNTLFWISKYVYRVRDPRELCECVVPRRHDSLRAKLELVTQSARRRAPEGP